jgi:hypothetical protein
MDISKTVLGFVEKHGAEKTAEVTGKAVEAVTSWGRGKSPTLETLQKLINHDPQLFFPASSAPEPAGEPVSIVAPYEFPAGKRVHILMPSVRPIHIGVLKAVTALYERDKMQLTTVADNSYVRARNRCAQAFLDGGAEYSFWLDDDTVLPHGDVAYFRSLADNPSFPPQYININPIAKLIQTGRSLVGGCYFGRQPGGTAQFQEAYQSTITNDAAHAGPRNVVNPTGWVGFGCALVHRSVFIDIISKQPDVTIKNQAFTSRFGYNYGFFNYIEDFSEDVSFCIRAKNSGHQAYVDMSVMPLHMGTIGYSYHNTTRRPVSR